MGSLDHDCVKNPDPFSHVSFSPPIPPSSEIQEEIAVEQYGQVYCYNFDYVLTMKNSLNVPINNYTFDNVSFPDLPTTLILRLNEPLPTSLQLLDEVGIEKEIIVSQNKDII